MQGGTRAGAEVGAGATYTGAWACTTWLYKKPCDIIFAALILAFSSSAMAVASSFASFVSGLAGQTLALLGGLEEVDAGHACHNRLNQPGLVELQQLCGLVLVFAHLPDTSRVFNDLIDDFTKSDFKSFLDDFAIFKIMLKFGDLI
jgi:hypothetical protein